MRRLRGKRVLFYGSLALFLLIFYAFESAPGLFQIAGVKPILLAGFMTAFAMRSAEVPAAVFGGLAGLLWDLSSHTLFGFHGLFFFAGAVAVSLLTQYLMQPKLVNFLLFTGVILLVDRLFYELFYYVIWQYESSGLVLLRYLLPQIGYSLIAGIPIYYFIRFFVSKFGETDF